MRRMRKKGGGHPVAQERRQAGGAIGQVGPSGGSPARGRRRERLLFSAVFIGEGVRMGAGANNQPLTVLRPARASAAREGGGGGGEQGL